MAKKKELAFKDLLTKLGNIFPGDLFIIDGQDVVEGRKSFVRNDGHYTCVLTPEAVECVKSEYPDYDYIYIDDVKKAKTDPSTYIITNKKKMNLKNVDDEREIFLSNCEKIDSWNSLRIDEQTIDDIFEGKDVTIIIPKYDKTNVNLSKSLLPLVTKKNIDELRYSVRDVKTSTSEKIIDVIFSMDHEYFTLYMVYSYLVC